MRCSIIRGTTASHSPISKPMEQDLLAINEKFDAKIAKAEETLSDLKARKQQKREQIRRYYEAVAKKAEIDAIIKEGKPVI